MTVTEMPWELPVETPTPRDSGYFSFLHYCGHHNCNGSTVSSDQRRRHCQRNIFPRRIEPGPSLRSLPRRYRSVDSRGFGSRRPSGRTCGTHIEVAKGKGYWREQIKVSKQLAMDELVWHRVRYRFEYSDAKIAKIEGTESISQILRMPVIHILGQQSYLTGGPRRCG